MLSTLPLERLSNFEKEELQLKVKKNAKYEDVLRLFGTIPIYPVWPLSCFHMECCYAQDYNETFVNFLSYNAWNHIDEIDIPHHSCGDKVLKYEVEGKTIKFSNLHPFPQLCFTALEDWEIVGLDVKTAFLFRDLDEDIYLTQPEGFIKKGCETLVCYLKKSFYSLKQAVLQWNKALHKSVTEMGFTQTYSDPGVYVFFEKSDIVIMLMMFYSYKTTKLC